MKKNGIGRQLLFYVIVFGIIIVMLSVLMPKNEASTQLDRYDELFDLAAEAVKGDPLRLWRVEKNRLSIRWVRLWRACIMRKEYDAEAINKFFTDWRAYNMSRLDEWSNWETSHIALLKGLDRGADTFEHWTGEGPEIL